MVSILQHSIQLINYKALKNQTLYFSLHPLTLSFTFCFFFSTIVSIITRYPVFEWQNATIYFCQDPFTMLWREQHRGSREELDAIVIPMDLSRLQVCTTLELRRVLRVAMM